MTIRWHDLVEPLICNAADHRTRFNSRVLARFCLFLSFGCAALYFQVLCAQAECKLQSVSGALHSSLMSSSGSREIFTLLLPQRRRTFTFFGFAGALSSRGFNVNAAEPAITRPLPVDELSLLHRHFGGDASVQDNKPMPQSAPSGGTISALSVQLPALQKLAPYLSSPSTQIFDLGFGSGVMVAMMLAIAGENSHVDGVDLADKVPVANANLLTSGVSSIPYVPFQKDSFSLTGGDAFERLLAWKNEGKKFDVVYAGCSMDPNTDQLRHFLRQLKPTGAAVFNLGNPGNQGMYFVADGGRVCELLMVVNFMMAVSPQTPQVDTAVPMEPAALGAWIRENIFTAP